MKVVWVDKLEWRICLPDGRYVSFNNLAELVDRSAIIANLIQDGIEAIEKSVGAWLQQDAI